MKSYQEECDERTAWLKYLKVGDEVAIANHSFDSSTYSVKTITKITPTGIIRVDNRTFLPNGREVSPYCRYPGRIVPYDDEVKAEMRRIKALSGIQILDRRDFIKLSTDQLEQILAMFRVGK